MENTFKPSVRLSAVMLILALMIPLFMIPAASADTVLHLRLQPARLERVEPPLSRAGFCVEGRQTLCGGNRPIRHRGMVQGHGLLI